MKFTLCSEQYGTTVEINFEATHIDQIRDMFNQFLRGSGFHFEDEEEQISVTTDNDEISATADKTWIGLTEEERCTFVSWFDDKTVNEIFNAIEVTLKERNNG
jgi:hypothetical protein